MIDNIYWDKIRYDVYNTMYIDCLKDYIYENYKNESYELIHACIDENLHIYEHYDISLNQLGTR